MIFTGGRSSRLLDGDWSFCVDLLDSGLRRKWFSMLPVPAAERGLLWGHRYRRVTTASVALGHPTGCSQVSGQEVQHAFAHRRGFLVTGIRFHEEFQCHQDARQRDR